MLGPSACPSTVLVCVVDGGAQIVEIQSVGRHGARVRHDAHRRPLPPLMLTTPTP